MHKIARSRGHTHHSRRHKHPHHLKGQVLRKAAMVMPLLLTQYKRIKHRPVVTSQVILGLSLLSALLLWVMKK
jgi:hypothetical protein